MACKQDMLADALRAKKYEAVALVHNETSMGVMCDLKAFLLERGMGIANGYGDLKGKTVRIAHMGEMTIADLNNLINAIDDFMKR